MDIRILWTVLGGVALVAGAVAFGTWPHSGGVTRIDPTDAALIAQGAAVYAHECASCHGANLEGQTNWRERKPDGRLPAPPHDASGHTWHHSDAQLFDLTKHGLGPYAPAGYVSDMPAYAGRLDDEAIVAVLAFIKSRWPSEIRTRQAEMSAPAGAR